MSNFGRVPAEVAEKAVLASIVLCLILQAWLASIIEINWDEFYFLSQIYDYQRGELTNALQTIHVHLFGWLTSLPDNEIIQVEVGRLVMLGCEAVTCSLIYLLVRCFFLRNAALLAVLAYVSAGFTMLHGASFRTDPLAAMLIMAALVILARAPSSVLAAIAAASLAALSALVSVKVAFYAPAFAAIAAWRLRQSPDFRRQLGWLVATGFLAIAVFGILYWLHAQSLPHASVAGSQKMMHGAASTTLIDAGFFPRLREVGRAGLFSLVQCIFMAVALIGIIIAAIRQPSERFRLFVLLGCAAPLLSILFYRNAFPYFFPFILPPAVVLIGWISSATAWPRFGSPAVAALMTLCAADLSLLWSQHDQAAQRQLVAAVHRIFPRPVAYIDRNSMIGSFPKRGPFMSTWGMQGYRAGSPVYANLLQRETIPLLLINGPALDHAAGTAQTVPENFRLLPQDEQVLRSNFIPHWGRIWVAGKKVEARPAGSTVRILVPGLYTVEGGSISIDGKPVGEAATVQLGRGRHTLQSSVPRTITLRWGDHLYRPPEPATPGPVFRGF